MLEELKKVKKWRQKIGKKLKFESDPIMSEFGSDWIQNKVMLG